jgi:hypothetical protein
VEGKNCEHHGGIQYQLFFNVTWICNFLKRRLFAGQQLKQPLLHSLSADGSTLSVAEGTSQLSASVALACSS